MFLFSFYPQASYVDETHGLVPAIVSGYQRFGGMYHLYLQKTTIDFFAAVRTQIAEVKFSV
jgi:hypothetical protein